MQDKLITIDKITDVEKHLDGIEAVIFDLDDTLYPEKEYVYSGFRKIAAYFGYPEFASELWKVFNNGGIAIDEVLAAHAMCDRKDEALHIYRNQNPDINLFSGVEEMIARLSISHKIGILTDGRPEGQRAKIKALGLHVDEIIITDELGGIEYRKPNPTAFILMQKRLDIPFERMAYVGDNLKKDFQAPLLHGMRSIFFNNKIGLYYNGV